MGSKRPQNDEETERRDQRSSGLPRRSSSLNIKSARQATAQQGRKSDIHLAPPTATQQRGRSADARSRKNQHHLSPSNSSSRRSNSEAHRKTSHNRNKNAEVTKPPKRHETPKPNPVSPNQAKRIEERKNLTQQDLRRVVTKAADMVEKDAKTASEAADMVLAALLWEPIQKLPRSDDDIVIAKEYLTIFYCKIDNFATAEDFSRQVLAARMAKKQPDTILVRDARQKLIQVLIRIGTQHRDKGRMRKADQVIGEALDLAVMNISTRNNPKTRADAKDVLLCCSDLLEHGPRLPKDRARVIEFKIKALQKTSNKQSFDDLKRIISQRYRLLRIYVLELQNTVRGQEIHNEIQNQIQGFQLGALDRMQKEAAISLSKETEAVWKSMLNDPTEAEGKMEIGKSEHGGLEGAEGAKPKSGPHETLGPVDQSSDKQGPEKEDNRGEEDNERIEVQQQATEKGEKSGGTAAKSRTSTGLTDNDQKFVLFDATKSTSQNQLSEERIQELIRFRRGILPLEFDDKTTKRIRLTVIDTGIDASHPFIERHWHQFRAGANKTKLPLFKDFDSSLDVPVDEDGHGTFIAGLVLRIAPDVELSVARVCKNQASMTEDKFWEDKIAQAVYYAQETWKTDIISISLGSDMATTGKLRVAIKIVQKSDVVFFCAVGNHGITRESLPVPARLEGVFKIFSCDHNGHASTMNPQPTSNGHYCFGILGCDVQSIWPSALESAAKDVGLNVSKDWTQDLPGLSTTMSGTSFATPIAAALVAIMYQFYDENKAIRFKKLPPSVDFKTQEVVKAILLRMSLRGIDGHKTLAPTSGRNNHFKFYPMREKNKVISFANALRDVVFQEL